MARDDKAHDRLYCRLNTLRIFVLLNTLGIADSTKLMNFCIADFVSQTQNMIFVLQTQYSSTEAGGGGNLVFLDRLRVSCTNGGALTSFKLERQGADAVCKRPCFLLLLRSVGVACARMPPDGRAKPLRV